MLARLAPLLLVASTASAMDRSRLIDPRLAEFLGDNAKVIQESTSVELLRFGEGGPKGAKSGRFSLAFAPPPVRKDLADALRRAVLDAHNYELASGGEDQTAYRLCRFEPLLGLRFRGAKAFADVLVSFKCNELGVILTGKQRAAALARADDREFGTADISSGRGRFLSLAQALLPDAEDVRAVEPTPTLSRLRQPLDTALRVEAFRVNRLPFPADAHAHWKRIPRGAQAANLYEIQGDVEPLADKLRRRAGKLLSDEAFWYVPLTRLGEGLATHCLRFVWWDARRKTETSVDVLIGGGGQWVEIAELVDTAGARTNRHVLDAQPLQVGPLLELVRDVFPYDKEFRE